MGEHNSSGKPQPKKRRLVASVDALFLLAACILGIVSAIAVYWILFKLHVPSNNYTGWKVILSVVYNCGPGFATVMCFFGVTGITYLLLLCHTQRIPRATRIIQDARGLDKVILQQFSAKQTVPSARPKSGSTESTSGMGLSADAQASAEIWNKDSPDPPLDAASPASSQAEGSSASPASTPTPPPAETTPQKSESLNLPEIHPWLRDRVQRVIQTLLLQGPEAARSENLAVADQQEDEVATSLLPAQLCEWILPLIGFLGTVYGLHLAIPPLKEGVELMMKAMGNPGPESVALRDQAMRLFGEGFEGLKVAFDTTMVGLAGVMLIGGGLYFVRRRAMQALSQVGNVTDRLVLRCPRESLSVYLQHILQTLRGGLYLEEQDRLLALLPMLRETIAHGLLSVQEGQKEPVPWLARVPTREDVHRAAAEVASAAEQAKKEIREELRADTRALAEIGLDLLQEEAKQTEVLWNPMAPDLSALRRHFVPDKRPPPPRPPLRGIVVAKFPPPPRYQIDALAIADGASRACAAGINREVNMAIVQETLIRGGRDQLIFERGHHYVDSLFRGGKDTAIVGKTVSAAIKGMSYHPEARRLFVLGADGEIRVFEDGQMKTDQLSTPSVPMMSPFLWLGQHEDNPFLGLWPQEENGEHRFKLFSASTKKALPVCHLTDKLLDSLKQCFPPDPAFIKIAAREGFVALAGGGWLAVCALQRNQLTLVEQCKFDGVTALDVSAKEKFVLFATENGKIHRWNFAHRAAPKDIAAVPDGYRVSGLFLAPSDDAAALVIGGALELQALNDLTSPRTLADTGGARVELVTQTLNRAHLLAATETNTVILFDIRTRIPIGGTP